MSMLRTNYDESQHCIAVDLTNMLVVVDLARTLPPKINYRAIDVTVAMPAGLSAVVRDKLERAVGACPIKHSVDPDIAVSTDCRYPD